MKENKENGKTSWYFSEIVSKRVKDFLKIVKEKKVVIIKAGIKFLFFQISNNRDTENNKKETTTKTFIGKKSIEVKRISIQNTMKLSHFLNFTFSIFLDYTPEISKFHGISQNLQSKELVSVKSTILWYLESRIDNSPCCNKFINFSIYCSWRNTTCDYLENLYWFNLPVTFNPTVPKLLTLSSIFWSISQKRYIKNFYVFVPIIKAVNLSKNHVILPFYKLGTKIAIY